MFTAVYPDGSFVTKKVKKQLFDLPGFYFVFKTDTDAFRTGNLPFFSDIDSEGKSFTSEYLELVGIDYSPNPDFKFEFSVFDHQINSIIKLYSLAENLPSAITSIVKEIITASNYKTYKQYQEVQNIENYKKEIMDLKSEIIYLKQNVNKV